MDFLLDMGKIFLLSVVSLAVLLVLTKLMGNKQLSQLTMFDYITGITIGSIAAEMSTSLEDDFFEPLFAMIIFGAAAFLISFFTCKSRSMRLFFTGRSHILFHNNRLYSKNLLKARLDINEFLMLCRNSGYFNLSDIYAAVLEPNGKLSIIPTAESRPVQPRDMNLFPQQEVILANTVVDGIIVEEVLKKLGRDAKWLRNELRLQGFPDVNGVALATCDNKGCLTVYKKITDEKNIDLLD